MSQLIKRSFNISGDNLLFSPGADSFSPLPPPPPLTYEDNMLISASRLAALPDSGSEWSYMLARADNAVSGLNLSESTPNPDSPWLPNYNGGSSVSRPGTQTLAMALVWAKTRNSIYKDSVITALRFLIGTEDELPNDGTFLSDRLLATARQIPAWVMAADIINMDNNLTGSRLGYTGISFGDWLLTLRDKEISDATSGRAISQTNNERAHNWGCFCSASRVAMDIYLGDENDLAIARDNLKRWCGDRTLGSLGVFKINEQFSGSHAGWSADGFSTVTLADDTLWPGGGDSSLRFSFTDPTPNRANGFRSNTNTGLHFSGIDSSKRYQLRAKCRVNNLPNGGFTNLRIQWYDTSDVLIGTTINQSSDYRTGIINLVWSVIPPSGAAYCWVGIYGNSGFTGGELYDTNVSYITMNEIVGKLWSNSSDFDPSYICLPAGYIVEEADWTAVNPSSCGPRKDGLLVEDISRSAVSYADTDTYYDDTGIGYMIEGINGQMVAAMLLYEHGETDVWSYTNQALKRAMDWLNREGFATGQGYDAQKHISWVMNYYYNETYPTLEALQGRCLGYTDWLFPSS